MMKQLLLLAIFLFILNSINAQQTDLEKIKKQWTDLLETDDKSEKIRKAKLFQGMMENQTYSFRKTDSFSDFENMSDIRSKDSVVRLISWFIPINKDEFLIGGIVSAKLDSSKDRIVSMTSYLTSRDSISLDSSYSPIDFPTSWFYDIIQKTDRFNRTYYTLIGWKPMNRLEQMKTIDVFYINKENKAFFGAPVFNIKGKRTHRLIYGYSAQTSMKVRYNESQDWIIMDHLSPSSPQFDGMPEYYGPDFSFDAFRWENDSWNYLPDVDVDQGVQKKKSDFKKEDAILEKKVIYESKER